MESASKVVVKLSSFQIEEFFIPMLKRLTAGEWFTSRASACGLYPSVYPLCNAITQDDLRK